MTRVAALSTLQATWKGENLRLLGPARIGFGNDETLDHLRVGLEQGVIEANGRVSPTLALTVAMHNLPADLTALFAPGLCRRRSFARRRQVYWNAGAAGRQGSARGDGAASG